MALVVTKLDSNDPNYKAGVDLYSISGSFTGAPPFGMTLPTICALDTVQTFLAQMEQARDQALAPYTAMINAANEVITALQAAGD
jgi:hypothetical protein